MSNPAPTLNQINAFNATQGTTIDFNIIGGTEVIRSNRIYIYDLSDNSLICTHLYVSTESIHELPPNTDSSIVYESGKSSSDFTNNTQYYAQIQTFTDTNGTQGASGLSVAKLFWCLPTPTLTLSTIPTTISTTSYNASATYTDTSASVVSNIIQQYQFNLYNATGSLLQSSGVVVGSGTQQGTSDVYDISYNFTGLNVGNSYYVTVEVTTTQGMSVSAQSNTFIVSIDTPTLGEATVVNNACDGYISVTSNLSGEYGGSASGEIASFVTNSINNVSSLKVSLEPLQDLHGYDKPWVGGAGKNKFNVTATTQTVNGITFTVHDDGTVTVNGTATDQANLFLNVTGANLVNGTAYIINGCPTGGGLNAYGLWATNDGITDYGSGASFTYDGSAVVGRIRIASGTVCNNLLFKPMVRLATESDATFAPWENLCPITGWTGCEVVVSPTEDAQDGTTYPVSWQTEAGTVYGGTVDLVTGVLTVDRVEETYEWADGAGATTLGAFTRKVFKTTYASVRQYTGDNIQMCNCVLWKHDYLDQSAHFYVDTGNAGSNNCVVVMPSEITSQTITIVYGLATPTTYQLTPTQIHALVGVNNVWSDAGEVEVTYNIPITNLLVKRQDVADVSGAWLTLYSQPITQASDMDFTFIDFTNQYGKTYKYALVPLLTQIQSGVEVEIEGGYTVSDNVDSIFDGVYIADQTNVERVKAGVGYGNVDMNQSVGSITPIGSKYPIVITNSQNQYHNGSIRGTIVPNYFYSNGNLSRIDMVNKRDELEQFLTNKRAKIIKDWNGKMWLVMILSNVACTFDDNYGMGMVEFSADWVEVGDPTNQQDLYNAGLINVGGV